jgi:hypothetical protein
VGIFLTFLFYFIYYNIQILIIITREDDWKRHIWKGEAGETHTNWRKSYHLIIIKNK